MRLEFIPSLKAIVGFSFRGEYWYGVQVKCNSNLIENKTIHDVFCNSTNGKAAFKIPKEGTRQCIQVCSTLRPVNNVTEESTQEAPMCASFCDIINGS